MIPFDKGHRANDIESKVTAQLLADKNWQQSHKSGRKQYVEYSQSLNALLII